MEFGIPGPLEVWDGGGEVSLGGPKPRALLAVLLLHPNEVVPADRLIEELWREEAPERAAACGSTSRDLARIAGHEIRSSITRQGLSVSRFSRCARARRHGR
jgi:hypothetical protein